MSTLQDLVQSLLKVKMGGSLGEADQKNVIFGLEEFSSAQRQRGNFLVLLLVILLVAPLILTQLKLNPQFLPYLLGGTGIFAAGTVKLLIDAFRALSTSHTLAIVCQGLQSTDAKEVLTAWISKQ